MKPLILDSALGTELENRGEYLPSFKTSIWSAYSLIHNPEIIKQILIDNIEAGADVITTSNYQATPELLKREPTAPAYEDLAKRSLELCKEAVIKPDQYKDFVVQWIEKGASVVGGCCRKTTEHIKEIKKIVDNL